MDYLLDTHVLIWMVEASKKLNTEINELLRHSSSQVLAVSAITPWEIAKKTSIGKLHLSLPLSDWLQQATSSDGITPLPLSVDISIEANTLPGDFHKDPADQIIVATARKHNLQLITADTRILAYPYVHTLKAN